MKLREMPIQNWGYFMILRIIVLGYSIILTFVHAIVSVSTVLQRLLEIPNPLVSTCLCAMVVLVHLIGLLFSMLDYRKPNQTLQPQFSSTDSSKSSSRHRHSSVDLSGIFKSAFEKQAFSKARVVVENSSKEPELSNISAEYEEKPKAAEILESRGRRLTQVQHCHNATAIVGQFIQAGRGYVISQGVTTTIGPKIIALCSATICTGIITLYAFKVSDKRKYQIQLTKIMLYVQMLMSILIPIMVLSSIAIKLLENPNSLLNRNTLSQLLSEGRLFVFSSFTVAVGQLYPLIHAQLLFPYLTKLYQQEKLESYAFRRIGEPDTIISDSKDEKDEPWWKSIAAEKWINRLNLAGVGYSLLLISIAFTADLKSSCMSELGQEACILPSYPWLGRAGICHCLSVDINCNRLKKLKGWSSSQVHDFMERRFFSHFSNHIIRLQINECEFKSLPASIGQLEDMLWMDVLGGQVEEYTLDLSKKKHLLTLVIKFQPIETVPSVFSKLPDSLMIFVMAHTSIHKLPAWSQEDAKGLLWVGAYSNRLSEFPVQLFTVPSIKRLVLHNNLIPEVPPGIQKMTNLTVLMMASNRLHTIDPGIVSMKNLQVIMLDGNNLSTVPWEKDQIIQWNIEMLESDSQHLDFISMLTFGDNPVCSDTGDLHATRACIQNCRPMCSRYFLENTECNAECNTKECGYDRGYCVTKPSTGSPLMQ